MNKHVESLSKVDKSITFHYCTVICDVLRLIDVILWKDNTNCIWFLPFRFILKVGNFGTFSKRPKAKSVLALGGKAPPLIPWPGALPLDPAGSSAPRPSITGASHMYLGASISLTPALPSFSDQEIGHVGRQGRQVGRHRQFSRTRFLNLGRLGDVGQQHLGRGNRCA